MIGADDDTGLRGVVEAPGPLDDGGGMSTDAPVVCALADGALEIVRTGDLDAKINIAHRLAKSWYARSLDLGAQSRPRAMPDRPGRPLRPEL